MTRRAAILAGAAAATILLSGGVVASVLDDSPQEARPVQDTTADLNRQNNPPPAANVPVTDRVAAAVDDGGLRREPELAEVAVSLFEPDPEASDLSLLDDDEPPATPDRLDPRLQRVARMACLDPDDGLQL